MRFAGGKFMMKISTKGRYATRMLLYLAEHYGEGMIHLKDIAESEEISEKYLGQLIMPLKVAGLIKAGRGAHGGYFLSRHPDKIKLLDVLNATEGEINLVSNAEICSRSKNCVMRDIWCEFGINIQNMFAELTLSEILKRRGKRNRSNIVE
jgi:Rrf2 family protein